jgi:hypothetical protein
MPKVYAEMDVGLNAQYPLFSFDFNQNWDINE